MRKLALRLPDQPASATSVSSPSLRLRPNGPTPSPISPLRVAVNSLLNFAASGDPRSSHCGSILRERSLLHVRGIRPESRILPNLRDILSSLPGYASRRKSHDERAGEQEDADEAGSAGASPLISVLSV